MNQGDEGNMKANANESQANPGNKSQANPGALDTIERPEPGTHHMETIDYTEDIMVTHTTAEAIRKHWNDIVLLYAMMTVLAAVIVFLMAVNHEPGTWVALGLLFVMSSILGYQSNISRYETKNLVED